MVLFRNINFAYISLASMICETVFENTSELNLISRSSGEIDPTSLAALAIIALFSRSSSFFFSSSLNSSLASIVFLASGSYTLFQTHFEKY